MSFLISFHNNLYNILERVYKETLDTVQQSFPQYVRELQGVADGSQVEFYKVIAVHALTNIDKCNSHNWVRMLNKHVESLS